MNIDDFKLIDGDSKPFYPSSILSPLALSVSRPKTPDVFASEMAKGQTGQLINAHFAGTTVGLIVDDTVDGVEVMWDMDRVVSIKEGLNALGFSTVILKANDTLVEQVRRARPVVCINLATTTHGPLGCAQVPSLLAMIGTECLGSNATALAVLRDRVGCLRVLGNADLPVPAFAEALTEEDIAVAKGLTFPVIVRGAGFGFDSLPQWDRSCRYVRTKEELAAVMKSLGRVAVIEETFEAGESDTYAVSVMGNRDFVSPLNDDFFDGRGYHVTPPLSITMVPAGENGENFGEVRERFDLARDLTKEQIAKMSDVAIAVTEKLGLRDFSRVDIEVNKKQKSMRVVAVHVFPAVDPMSIVTEATGEVSMSEFFAKLILVALTRITNTQQNLLNSIADAQGGGQHVVLDQPSFGALAQEPIRSMFSPFDKQMAKLRQRQAVVQDDVDVVVASSTESPKVVSTLPPMSSGLRGPDDPQQRPVSYRKSEVPPELWNNWRWQLANRLKTLDQLRSVLPLTMEEEDAFNGTDQLFPVAVTPYVASLIDPNDPQDPIRLQVLPRSIESHRRTEDIEDSLNEDEHMPVPGLVHRYPDRVLMLVSMTCGSYCRFCTRNRVVGTRLQTAPTRPLAKYYEDQLAYVRANKNVRDVLLSGGDPLLIPMRTLDWLLTELHKIEHVEVVRIGSRVPIFLPQRITREMCTMLASHHPLWLNTHVNHPNELTPDSCAALARLANSGIPLGCQTVLLAGVNDCPNIMMELVHKLVKNRVRPYYIYQCDLVVGASHFRTPVTKLIEIMEALRGHTSGFCVPTAVIDAPHGGGKVPIMPNYLISQSETKTIVRNFEGFVSTYTGPRTYKGHNSRTCKFCQAQKEKKDAQEGVSGLLAGHENVIKPEGWDYAHLSRRDLVPEENRSDRGVKK